MNESTVFREKFADWKEADGTLSVKQQGNVQAQDKKFRVYDRGSGTMNEYIPNRFQCIHIIPPNKDARKVEKILVEKMIEPDELAREASLFDLKHDGRGTIIKYWHCQEKGNVEVPENLHGQFYSSESYVILFEFSQKNREGPGERLVYVMYFWLGRDAPIVRTIGAFFSLFFNKNVHRF